MKTFFSFITNNWWLKLLALVLAIVIYHAFIHLFSGSFL